MKYITYFSVFYIIQGLLEFKEPVHLELLQQAWDTVIAQNEILRAYQ